MAANSKIKLALRLSLITIICIFLCRFVYQVAVAFSTFSEEKVQVHLYIDKNDSADSVYTKLSTYSTTQKIKLLKFIGSIDDYDKIIKTGHYVIKPEMNVLDTYKMLRAGQETPIKLVVPSVRTMQEMSRRLSKVIMPDSSTLSQCFADTNICKDFGKTPQTISCLFIPNTYEVYWDITPLQLLQRMEKESKKFWNEERRHAADSLGLSIDEIITLASIVDQETAYSKEKPTIAGLYLNRLRKGMLLQADPTVKYAVGDFSIRRILHKHLTVDSPYNTYLYKGLPPGPIAIPSIQSIDAVLNAAQHDYIYMCAKEDFSGSHNFAKNLSQHQRNARKYAAALNAKKIK